MAATATAQQLLAQALINRVNAVSNPPFRAHSPSPGVVRVECISTIEYFRITSSYFAGKNPADLRQVSGTAYDILLPHTTAPGDTITIDDKARVSVAYTARGDVASTAEVLPGGFNHNTQASTVQAAEPSDIRLVVMEAAKGHVDSGKLFALDPNQASGVPIPGMRVEPALPVTGTVIGESVFETATRTAHVWTGARWSAISPSPINQFPTDAQLKNDTTLSTGSYAVAQDTGNMYVRGAVGWRRIGIIHVSRTQDLPNDVLAGDQAIANDVGVLYSRMGGTPAGPGGVPPATADYWRPISIYEATEAEIRAATWALNGQSAISTDTGRTFAFINGNWIEEPINHYATEADLLAAAPQDGTLAWADDTHYVFTRAGGNWHRVGGSTFTIGTTVPSTPASGDGFYNTDEPNKGIQLWNGTQFVSPSPVVTRHVTSNGFTNAGDRCVVNLGAHGWKNCIVEGYIHVATTDTGLYCLFTGPNSPDGFDWVMMQANRYRVYQRVIYGNQNLQGDTNVVNGDWNTLTWMAKAENPNNMIHIDTDPAAYFKAVVGFSPDGRLNVWTKIEYRSPEWQYYDVETHSLYNTNAGHRNLRYMVLRPNKSTARLAFEGTVTTTG